MFAGYSLILGVLLLAVGSWLSRSERRGDTVVGLSCVIAATVLLLTALLEIFWPMP